MGWLYTGTVPVSHVRIDDGDRHCSYPWGRVNTFMYSNLHDSPRAHPTCAGAWNTFDASSKGHAAFIHRSLNVYLTRQFSLPSNDAQVMTVYLQVSLVRLFQFKRPRVLHVGSRSGHWSDEKGSSWGIEEQPNGDIVRSKSWCRRGWLHNCVRAIDFLLKYVRSWHARAKLQSARWTRSACILPVFKKVHV